MMAEMIRG